jgi:type IV pilus assembly protein PilO
MANSRDVLSQFQGLTLENVGTWPLVPRVALWLFIIAACGALGWFLVWKAQVDELDRLRVEEQSLKDQYRNKLQQAINLEELRRQKEQVSQYVLTLEKQLPSKAEMDALLSDINQAGLGRGLQFELFRPGQLQVRDYYAELPIAIRVSGRYHDIGSFAADVANLSRIVTLHNLTLTPPREAGGVIAMDATARTYRYLEKAESDAQQKAQAAAKGERK